MNKIYLTLMMVGLSFTGLYAQQTLTQLNVLGEETERIVTDQKPVVNQTDAKSVIWNEDFANGLNSVNGTWTLGGPNQIWKHSYFGTSGEWSAGTDPMASTTVANGFMLFDADSVNTPISPNYTLLTGELISPVINLSLEGSAMISFEHNARFCCAGIHDLYLYVSSDGGATWGTAHVVNAGQPSGDDFFGHNGNSYLTLLNISAEAAGQSNVKIKFTWDGNLTGDSHYYWSVDDICIFNLPANDLQLSASRITGENNEGNQYGRTPENHQDGNYLVESQVYNFGENDQTNLIWEANFGGGLLSTATHPQLVSGNTVILESTEAWGPLAVGVYSGDYNVVSDGETQASPEYANNIGLREFEITPASTDASSVYSLDGIDVYTSSTISSLGTDSFTGSEDDFVVATMYHIKQAADISGIRIMLANGTVAGGVVYGSLKDTATVFANNMISIFETDSAIVNGIDISNGYVDLMFPVLVNLGPGAYFACAELNSNQNTSDIRILDDETVDQPDWSSVIYIPGDQTWFNGNALAIRLLMGDSWLGSENEFPFAGVSIFPNPSEGLLYITNDNNVANTITVHNLAGELILTIESSKATTIDLSANGTGVYLVTVANASGSMVERIVIR